MDLQEQLEIMALYMPNERKQCEYIWKPVYDEYRRLGYRLKKYEKVRLIWNWRKEGIMEKTIRLLDYENNEKIFIVNDFEEVKVVIFEIVSGDGVLTLIYQDGKIRKLDSSDKRLIDFKDGIWVLEPKDIDVINDMKYHDDTEKLDEAELNYENWTEQHLFRGLLRID